MARGTARARRAPAAAAAAAVAAAVAVAALGLAVPGAFSGCLPEPSALAKPCLTDDDCGRARFFVCRLTPEDGARCVPNGFFTGRPPDEDDDDDSGDDDDGAGEGEGAGAGGPVDEGEGEGEGDPFDDGGACTVACAVDADCFAGGTDVGLVCVDGACTAEPCTGADECVALFGGWTRGVCPQQPCPGGASVCVLLGDEGYCVAGRDADRFGDCTIGGAIAQEEAEVVDAFGNVAVVCVQPGVLDAVCTFDGRCENRCRFDEDCGAAGVLFCREEDGACVQCFVDADCTFAGLPRCTAFGTCGCGSDADCGAGNGVPGSRCFVEYGTCTCANDAECGGGAGGGAVCLAWGCGCRTLADCAGADIPFDGPPACQPLDIP